MSFRMNIPFVDGLDLSKAVHMVSELDGKHAIWEPIVLTIP